MLTIVRMGSLDVTEFSQLTPYQAYLLEHAADGQRTVRQLYRDIQAQGFTGSLSTVATYLASAHQRPIMPNEPESPASTVSMFPASRLTPRRATWLLLSSPDRLTEEQRQLAQQVAHLNSEVEQVASEAQAFVLMIRLHIADTLDPWLDRTRHCTIRELRTFAREVQRDYQAVKAGLVRVRGKRVE